MQPTFYFLGLTLPSLVGVGTNFVGILPANVSATTSVTWPAVFSPTVNARRGTTWLRKVLDEDVIPFIRQPRSKKDALGAFMDVGWLVQSAFKKHDVTIPDGPESISGSN